MLSQRFHDAARLATELHAGQTRKGTQIPYVSHLLAVTALVIEYGGNEDQAIAALLHDAVEDQGGLRTLSEIRERFGDPVADVVDALSDAYGDADTVKPPWRERKEAYLAALPTHPPSALLVSAADKLHNATTILRDLRSQGNTIWDRFNGGRDGTLWYYRALVSAFEELGPSSLAAELKLVVEAMTAFSEADARQR